MYNFNFVHIARSFLPAYMSVFWYYYTWCILRPITAVKNAFTTYRVNTLKNMATGQVILLEYLLNDLYNQAAPTAITITDIDTTDDLTYIGLLNETYDVYLSTEAEEDPVYLMTIPEAPIFGFQVNVFQDFYDIIVANGEIDRMHSIIRKHKAAGFYYEIVPYQI